jgi:YVTN family beta-propeller protein
MLSTKAGTDDIPYILVNYIGVFESPESLVTDPSNNNIYVASLGSESDLPSVVSVISASTNALITTIGVGSGAASLTYNPANKDVYVVNSVSNTTSVISGASNAVIANVKVGHYPNAATYDGFNGDVYVSNGESNTISVISSKTNKVLATIPVGSIPTQSLYDPANKNVYVIDNDASRVSVIGSSTNKVIATIKVGQAPQALAYNPSNEEIYVTNQFSNTVSAIDGSTNRVTATIAVGSDPGGIKIGTATNNIYVSNEESGTISVISSSKNKVISTVNLGSSVTPWNIAYDTANNNIYVTGFSHAVYVISGSSNSLIAIADVGSIAGRIIYDSSNKDLYVVDAGSNNVAYFSSSIGIVYGTEESIWSGYALTASYASVTDVNGSWIVPGIAGDCSLTNFNHFSSSWIGIDGFGTNTVEQIGTNTDCGTLGITSISAWYEFYPQPQIGISKSVYAGDKMDAQIKYTGGMFVMTLTDLTQRWTFSTSGNLTDAGRSTAEWITERTSVCNIFGVCYLSLTDFGNQYWGSVYTGAQLDSATISGVSGTMGSFTEKNIVSVYGINMTNSNYSYLLDETSPLVGSDSFSIAWRTAS